jgi:hypothetical protein
MSLGAWRKETSCDFRHNALYFPAFRVWRVALRR